jgi:hypothetical protein
MIVESRSRDKRLQAIITTILILAPFLAILYKKKDDPISPAALNYALDFVLKVLIFVDASRVAQSTGITSLMPNGGLQELYRGGAMSVL